MTTTLDARTASSPEALGVVLDTAACLAGYAAMARRAEYRRAAGYTGAALDTEGEMAAALVVLRESPSIARLRSAVILLAGITDETLVDLVARYLDRLSLILARVDAGEI